MTSYFITSPLCCIHDSSKNNDMQKERAWTLRAPRPCPGADVIIGRVFLRRLSDFVNANMVVAEFLIDVYKDDRA